MARIARQNGGADAPHSNVRIATWNIRAGGGKRIEGIARVLLEEAADVVALTEFRPVPGVRLLEALKPLGYHAVMGVPTGPQNSVCLLSRSPIEVFEPTAKPDSAHRWLSARIPEHDLDVLAVHIPNQSEIWNKRQFWECVESFAQATVEGRTLLIGDMNTALDEDCEGDPIREAVHLIRLSQAGWVDAWRATNATAREFTWYSHRNNGFRLDHCLVSPSLAPNVHSARYRHDVRLERLSDHSALCVELK